LALWPEQRDQREAESGQHGRSVCRPAVPGKHRLLPCRFSDAS
jgi:hypothetical protein